MKRVSRLIVFCLMFSFSFAALIPQAIAQEETPPAELMTNTEEVTLAPTLAVTDVPAEPTQTPPDPVETTRDIMTIVSQVVAAVVTAFVAGGLTVGGIVLLVVRSFNHTQKEAMRRLFYSVIPPETLAMIRAGLLGADELIEFGKEVTAPPAVAQKGYPRRE